MPSILFTLVHCSKSLALFKDDSTRQSATCFGVWKPSCQKGYCKAIITVKEPSLFARCFQVMHAPEYRLFANGLSSHARRPFHFWEPNQQIVNVPVQGPYFCFHLEGSLNFDKVRTRSNVIEYLLERWNITLILFIIFPIDGIFLFFVSSQKLDESASSGFSNKLNK